MENSTPENIRRVYSILPESELDLAVRETLRSLGSNELEGWQHALKWAEFARNRAVLRSGRTDLVERITTIFPEPERDEDISIIIDEVKTNGIEAGRIVYFPERDRFIWFLPVASLGSDAISNWHLKGFIVTESFFSDLVRHFNPDRRVTPAESRVAFQLIAGASPRDAAEQDEVTVETKRAQIKSVAAKLNCTGQTDLVRMLIGQLSHIAAISNSQFDAYDDAEKFVARYLAEDVTLGMHRLPNGRLLRVLECGRSDATPIVVIHGVLFPNLIFGASEHLRRNRLKLVIPLRRGYLERVHDRASENLVLDAMEDIAHFNEKSFSDPPLVMGHSYGAPIALRLAADYPDRVRALAMLSAHFGNARHASGSYAAHFFGGLRRVIHDNAMAEAIAHQFAKHYVKPARARKILVKLFRENDCDLSVLEGNSSRPPSYDWFIDMYQRSLTGIADDFRFAMTQQINALERPGCSLSFLHADGDPLSPMETVSRISNSLSGNMIPMPPEAGHFVAASHPGAVWNTVGEWAKEFAG